MACTFAVLLNADRDSDATEHGIEALELVDRLEQQLSVYRATSDVSELNRSAHQAAQMVESDLLDLINRCIQRSIDTNGAFDITSAPLGRAWGFHHRQASLPDANALDRSLQCVGYDRLRVDNAKTTLSYQDSSVSIDFGAVGKGYALDRCARQMEDGGVTDFMIHGGKSSVLARGSRSGAGCAGWKLDLRHPLRPDEPFLRFRLCDKGLGTSGDATQHFYHQGKRYGHILDPRSGWPATGVISSTVIAAEAETADALATAFYVMGPRDAAEYCRRFEDVSAVLTTETETAGRLRLHLLGMDDQDWELLAAPSTIDRT